MLETLAKNFAHAVVFAIGPSVRVETGKSISGKAQHGDSKHCFTGIKDGNLVGGGCHGEACNALHHPMGIHREDRFVARARRTCIAHLYPAVDPLIRITK